VKESSRKNSREMSDEELQAWRKKVAEAGLLGTPAESRRSLNAIQTPIRREIMTPIKDKALKVKEIADKLNLEEDMLKFHLQILENAGFIKIEGDTVDLRPGGVAYTRNVLR
jgi:predicted transcriptional regulator